MLLRFPIAIRCRLLYNSVMTTAEKSKSAAGYTPFVYILFLTALITLIPFRFRLPGDFSFSWYFYISGFAANVFLFMPVGFLLRLAQRNPRDKACVREFIFGVLFSLTIELVQGFMPDRVTSGYDLLANGTGAWMGAWVLDVFRNHINKERTARLLELELPLMNQVYLLIPLLWLSGLTAGTDTPRLLLTALLGIYGAYLLTAVYTFGLKPKGAVTAWGFTFLVVGWLFVSSFPALIRRPGYVIVFLVGAGILIRLRLRWDLRFRERTGDVSRRYELPVLKRLLPVYVVYLVLLFAWPGASSLVQLQHDYVVEGVSRVTLILCFLERIAAFTLLGYIIAEMRGRTEGTVKRTFAWILSAPVTGWGMERLIRWGPPFTFLTLAELLFIAAAALCGGVIYHLQLKAIREMEFL